MTLRELLKSLHAVDGKHLDVEVLVSPSSGGYATIDHTSILYVGHAVIHLAEPKAQETPDLWAGSQEGDSVAAVSPDDLRKVWQLFRDAQARNPGECTSIGNMMQMFPESPLTPWTHDGEFDDVVFQSPLHFQ